MFVLAALVARSSLFHLSFHILDELRYLSLLFRR
jgi:hypothetical protein